MTAEQNPVPLVAAARQAADGIAMSQLEQIRSDLFIVVEDVIRSPIHVKCEGLNVAGSIKLKPAVRMIEDLKRSGWLTSDSILVESSSGNLGIALSMIAAANGYRFICVTDPNATRSSLNTMRAMGTEVIVVTDRDANQGYLGTRIALIKSMCARDPRMIWINQYANEGNWRAHYDTTAPEILRRFPKVDWLFIGAGTTGTLMGCARYFRQASPTTRIVAVDAEGSVTFGAAAAPRLIPGLGTSSRPPILDARLISDMVQVSEPETIAMCRALARHGLLLGGSTGTVMAGIVHFADRIGATDIVVTISPDFGANYLDTIFDDAWVARHFPGFFAEWQNPSRSGELHLDARESAVGRAPEQNGFTGEMSSLVDEDGT
jgi:2,3-diaminopropionate biosynthesis protein SbnA